MTGLVLGVVAPILGCAVHLCLLRRLSTAWRLAVLPVALLVALAGLALFASLAGDPVDAETLAVALCLTLSLGFAYALVLVGVVYDSPTLSIINEIESYGPAGMPIAAFENFPATHPFVQSRLDALIAVGELAIDEHHLVLTGKSVVLLRIGEVYRRLRGGRNAEAG